MKEVAAEIRNKLQRAKAALEKLSKGESARRRSLFYKGLLTLGRYLISLSASVTRLISSPAFDSETIFLGNCLSLS